MAIISQAAVEIGTIAWTEGDPISIRFTVDEDWSGIYIGQIRKTHSPTGTLVGAFVVVTAWDTLAFPLRTLFTLSMTEALSKLITKGNYFTDIQEVGGGIRPLLPSPK